MITKEALMPYLDYTIDTLDLDIAFGKPYAGKVRNMYDMQHAMLMVTTDRQSAFDVSWCTIPLKGQVLNLLSAWWYRQLASICPHHMLDVPHPNAMLVKPLRMIPLEIVVRGYITGSTTTSLWYRYSNGERVFDDVVLPDHLKKNHPLPFPMLTPTTKGKYDAAITSEEIIERKIVTKEQWQQISMLAKALFAKGQEIARTRGLILVDTKYEMGIDEHGTIILADEVHTPDSSRYFDEATYQHALLSESDPQSPDKEYFRLWLKRAGYPAVMPHITNDVRLELAQRYIRLYENITKQSWILPKLQDPLHDLLSNVSASLQRLSS